MSVVTRFAPSPTGFLHLGGARTALFNWLFAKRYGGKFLLRIEDTDRVRSTDDAITQILNGLKWLGIEWDGDPILQHSRANRHREVVSFLMDSGRAYKCYCTASELEEMREKARKQGNPVRYDGTWRDKDPQDAPPGISPVVRFKALIEGETIIDDGVQGKISISNKQVDDMVLLRADGSPTYMLSVVVDDHDMGITDAIRGDDHLTNTARQTQLFKALAWETPKFSHIPLIHGSDGSKLSKRHGSVELGFYEKMGILPEAMCNYLLRLGWSHGDDELISQEQAIKWFSLDGIGKSPSRFDLDKLINMNGHYIRSSDHSKILDECYRLLCLKWGKEAVDENKDKFIYLRSELIQKSNTIIQIIESIDFIFEKTPISYDDKALKILTNEAKILLNKIANEFLECKDWSEEHIEEIVRSFVKKENIKLGNIAQPIRSALTGTNTSPGIFSIIFVLGRSEVIKRISDAVKK